MDEINGFLNSPIQFSDNIAITVQGLLIVILALFVTALVLKWIRKLVTRKLLKQDKAKFDSIFSFGRWFIYVIILLITFDNIGVNVTALFAASAALLIGIGLALQTLFQDIIAGIFIMVDQSVHVGDIIELEGKVGRVEEINLRTTRAVTVDNRVLIIPNHLYLTNSVYNWTANGIETRETIDVGVAYGSDVRLVESLLMQAAQSHPSVLKEPSPKVLFLNFGESSLDFRVAFTINDSFNVRIPKSDIRFEIDKLFREHKISIPFPQRDVHLISPTQHK